MPANSIKGYCPYSSFVGNKAKGRISKRVLEENKACQINFPKNQHFLPPPLDTHTFALLRYYRRFPRLAAVVS